MFATIRIYGVPNSLGADYSEKTEKKLISFMAPTPMPKPKEAATRQLPL